MHCRQPLARIITTCSSARHRVLSAGPREQWEDGTIPMHDGRRPVDDFGLEFGDCRAHHEATGHRYTITRRVRCVACAAPVDGCDYCSAACEDADHA